eukprot:170213_1
MSDMSGDIRPTLTEREINVCCRPYGIHKEKCLTSEESKKLHPKLKLARTIELKAGDKYFLYCIKRKCRNKSLKHAELIKARAYSEHLKEFHAKEPFDGYENEILIFSHWTISQDKKQYVKEYVLLDVVSSDGYRYVMVPKNRSPFNMQTGYEYSQVINIEKYQEQLEEKNQEQLEEKNPEEQQVIEDYLPSANEWVSRKEYEKVISMLKHILKCVDKTGQMHIDDYMGQKSIAKTLEKKLLLYLSLAKEDALSEQLVIKCAQIYLRKFNRDGILKKKRSNKSSIEFSKVIDKWLRYIDEGIFTLHAEDIQIIIQLNCDEVQIYK